MSCDSDPYIFTTDILPSDLRFLPPLANGLLGWRVYNNIMHMGGVYNGEGGQCHRADIPCPLAVKVGMEEPAQHTYRLNTHTGILCCVCLLLICVEAILWSEVLSPLISSSRHFYTHSEHSQCNGLTVLVLSPTLLQHDGDGDSVGAPGDVDGADYYKADEFVHTSKQRHCFHVWSRL